MIPPLMMCVLCVPLLLSHGVQFGFISEVESLTPIQKMQRQIEQSLPAFLKLNLYKYVLPKKRRCDRISDTKLVRHFHSIWKQKDLAYVL